MELTAQIPMIEAPRGMYPAKLDDRGRLKLPAPFERFLGALRERKLFVTSLDRKTAQIYPMEIWRRNEQFFESYREDPRAAQLVAFNAADLGAETEMDAQGRITLPIELRQELKIEQAPVRLQSYKGRIQILTEAMYQQLKTEAQGLASEAVTKMEAAGLN